MVTSAVLCLLVLWLLNSLRENVQYRANFWRRLIINVTVWSVFLTTLLLVSMSRVFIATHFPHQVILGTLIGLIIALFVRKFNLVLMKVSQSAIYCVLCSFAIIATTLLSYFILSLLVYDPSISVSKAQKWCVKSSYVHLDTTPFYALVRDSGVTVGLGISISSLALTLSRKTNWRGLSYSQMSLLSGSLEIILSILLLQLLEVIALPKSSPLLFYVSGYVRCSFIPFIVIFIVPNMVIWQWFQFRYCKYI